MSRSNLLLACACALILSACAKPIVFQSALSGVQEAPRTASAGTGTLTATLYPDSHALSYAVEYTGLSGPATAAHIHAPAAPGANAPVAIAFDSPATPIKGAVTLTAAQQQALMDGMAYVNIHTTANPGGEIRGQIARVP